VYVDGLTERVSKDHIDYGLLFHKLIEADYKAKHLSPNQLSATLQTWVTNKYTLLPAAELTSLYQLGQIAVMQFLLYREHWNSFRYNFVSNEAVFRVPYRVAGVNRPIPLRGRYDGIIKGTNGCLGVFETKTKGRIIESQIEATLGRNLQTMLYVCTAQEKYQTLVDHVVYNVIRKPQQTQRQDEDFPDFLARVEKDIKKRPEHYFHRWEHSLTQTDIESWKRRTLDPLLRAVAAWWESIQHDPFDPWVLENGDPNPHHFEKPFGITDPMTFGRGDFYRLLVEGNDLGLVRLKTAFPELEEDEENDSKENDKLETDEPIDKQTKVTRTRRTQRTA
jgi:hypothetical protein